MRKKFLVLFLKLDPQLFEFNLPLLLLLLEQLPFPPLLQLHLLYLHRLLVDPVRLHLLVNLVLDLDHQIFHVHLLFHLLHSLFIICRIVIVVKDEICWESLLSWLGMCLIGVSCGTLVMGR